MPHINHRYLILLLLLGAAAAASQSHDSNWLRRTATDTTVVRCVNDSLTHMRVPPGSMGMMFPDSMYCRIEILPMDSIPHPYDSTFIGWCRIRLGSDSLHFNYMNCDTGWGASQHMMQFMSGLRCQIYWDSLRGDSSLRHWRPTGVLAWTGSEWAPVPAVSFVGNTAGFSTSRVYSAYAVIGSPAAVTPVGDEEGTPGAFVVSQNYPNPFNPSTTIKFQLPGAATITLKVYNALGQVVATLLERVEYNEGEHNVVFAAPTFSSGLYYYQLEVEGYTGTREVNTTTRYTWTKKMLLVK